MNRSLRVVAALAVATLMTVAVWPTAGAQDAPPDPQDTVLAIVSPVASPACSSTGTATLLVPIVSGLIGSKLPTQVPSVGDLVLNSLGPVFVVCGSLPAPPGTRCQVDDQIAGLLPTDITSLTGPTPGFLGNTVDALNAAMKGLGLPPSAALGDALVCQINEGPGVVDAPPAPPAPPTSEAVVPSGTSAPPTFSAPVPTAAPIADIPTPTIAPPATQPVPQTVVSLLDEYVPGGLLALQLAVIGAIALVLGSGWAGSWREARREARA